MTGEQLLDALLKLPKEDLKKNVGYPDTASGSINILSIDHAEVSKNVAFFAVTVSDEADVSGATHIDAIVLY